MVIFLRRLIYNDFTGEIEEQGVFSLEYEVSEGYDDGEVSLSETPRQYEHQADHPEVGYGPYATYSRGCTYISKAGQ